MCERRFSAVLSAVVCREGPSVDDVHLWKVKLELESTGRLAAVDDEHNDQSVMLQQKLSSWLLAYCIRAAL